MITFNQLPNNFIEKIFPRFNKFIAVIDKTSKIINYNDSFATLASQYFYMEELITLAHKVIFMKNLQSMSVENNYFEFVTNFSFKGAAIDDLPRTYKIYLYYVNDDFIYLLADEIAPLHHEDAINYFQLVNEFSSMNREYIKAKFNLKKQKQELKNLNENLEIIVQEEVKKNLQKEILIMEQSKLAAMGSMIGNIIHQWRQPLSYISAKASIVQIEQTIGSTEHDVSTTMEEIIDAVNQLSETVNTFRNFLKEKKEKRNIILQETIKQALKISGTILHDNHIVLEHNLDSFQEPIQIETISTELNEVIINIINNASDVILEKNIEDGLVFLEIGKDDNFVTISIEDNGGGIPEDVMPYLFDEYFTTKDGEKGTGLGLYMGKKIVTQSLNGTLDAVNTQKGAKFTIKLPYLS